MGSILQKDGTLHQTQGSSLRDCRIRSWTSRGTRLSIDVHGCPPQLMSKLMSNHGDGTAGQIRRAPNLALVLPSGTSSSVSSTQRHVVSNKATEVVNCCRCQILVL